jgi:hypothetical protein
MWKVFFFLVCVAFAAANTCTEPKDSNGLTCSAFLKSGVAKSCPEMFQKFGFIESNGLHCKCACPEYYEPIGEDQKTCAEWQDSKNAQRHFLNEAGTTIQMAMEVCRIAPVSVQIQWSQSVATSVNSKSAGLTNSRSL